MGAFLILRRRNDMFLKERKKNRIRKEARTWKQSSESTTNDWLIDNATTSSAIQSSSDYGGYDSGSIQLHVQLSMCLLFWRRR